MDGGREFKRRFDVDEGRGVVYVAWREGELSHVE